MKTPIKILLMIKHKSFALINIFRHLHLITIGRLSPPKKFSYSVFKKNKLAALEIKALSRIKIDKKSIRPKLCCVWHIYKPCDVGHFLDFVREFSDIDHLATFNLESVGKVFLHHLPECQLMPQLSLYPVSNRGRDFRMVTHIFSDLERNSYDFFAKLHFKERDQITQDRLNTKKSLAFIKRHIVRMQWLASVNLKSKAMYGFKGAFIKQAPHIGLNQKWLQRLCKRAGLKYSKLLNQIFISGGMFVVSRPKEFLSLSHLVADHEFESEGRHRLDGLLCHALERFVSFYAVNRGYKLSPFPSPFSNLISSIFSRKLI